MNQYQPTSHFFQPAYERELNFAKIYHEQAAFTLSRSNGITLQDADNYVRGVIDKGQIRPVKNPIVNYIGRNEVGDRVKCTTHLEEYIRYVHDGRKLLSPTMVVIKSHDEQQGLRPKIVKKRIKRRATEKKAMFKYAEEGDLIRKTIAANNQNNIKRSLNAASGAYLSPYNILYQASCHPILTSNCRMAASSANSLNERFIEGNRPYYTANHVMDDISHTCCYMNPDDVVLAINTFNLYIPTADDVMEMIHYSSDLYWDSELYMSKIEKLVRGLNDIERTVVMYQSDLYQLRKYNDKVVRDLFTGIVEADKHQGVATGTEIEITDEAISILNKTTMANELYENGGINKVKENHPEIYNRLLASYAVIDNLIIEYIPIIRAFWANRITPLDVGNFPTSYRRIGLLSDTDSTVFTAQSYVNWYYENKDWNYSVTVWSIGAIITYFVSSITMHMLAQLMTNYGVNEENRYEYIMKPEFLFGALGLTGRGKTYYAMTLLNEGNIPKDGVDWDIKGSALIASKVANDITDQAEELLKSTIRKLVRNESISGQDIIQKVVDLENEITRSILAGEITYVKVETIRNKDAYKSANPHQYFNYVFWQDVYATTLGPIDQLPFEGVRFPLTTNTKGRFKAWVETITDPVIKRNVIKLFDEAGKSSFTSIVLPTKNIATNGIPKELIPIISIDALISTLLTCFYIILDSFGLLVTNTDDKKSPILVRDKLAQPFDENDKTHYIM